MQGTDIKLVARATGLIIAGEKVNDMSDFDHGQLPSSASATRRDILASAAVIALAENAPALGQVVKEETPLDKLKGAHRILFKNGIVLTMDRRTGDFADADVLVENGVIREVKPGIQASDALIIDAKARILLPGFVDTHSHSYQGLLRGLLPNGGMSRSMLKIAMRALPRLMITRPLMSHQVRSGWRDDVAVRRAGWAVGHGLSTA